MLKDAIVFLIAGLGVGAVYALLGLGIMTLFRATGVLNFAFAALGMIGVFAYTSLTGTGVPPAPAALIVVVGSAPAAALLELVCMRHLRATDVTTKAVATIALLVGLVGFANLVWGTDARAFPAFLPQWHAEVAGITLPTERIDALVAVIILFVALEQLFSRTRVGIAMRAMASDRATAALIGVPVGALTSVAWGVAGSLASFSILLVAPTVGIDSSGLSLLVISGLVAAMLGDLRSPRGVVLGGLVLGVVQTEAELWQWPAEHSNIVPFVLLLVVLLWRQRQALVPALDGLGGRV